MVCRGVGRVVHGQAQVVELQAELTIHEAGVPDDRGRIDDQAQFGEDLVAQLAQAHVERTGLHVSAGRGSGFTQAMKQAGVDRPRMPGAGSDAIASSSWRLAARWPVLNASNASTGIGDGRSIREPSATRRRSHAGNSVARHRVWNPPRI